MQGLLALHSVNFFGVTVNSIMKMVLYFSELLLNLSFQLGKSFLGKVGENGASGILVILTVSMEELASFFVFECPCDSHHFEYGLSYLLGR